MARLFICFLKVSDSKSIGNGCKKLGGFQQEIACLTWLIHQCSIGGALLGKLALGAKNYNHPINYLATSFGKLPRRSFCQKKESGHSDAAVEP